MQCNIDARGKRLRLTGGLIAIAIGLAFVVVALFAQAVWAWGIAVGVLTAGAFMTFEARAGWCALRAMGIKTRV